ncbi:MAG: TonB-dependent receptor [Bacteroidales bacterium]|nr:TonB-dependent receptor [Bacteroidales bacterium]
MTKYYFLILCLLIVASPIANAQEVIITGKVTGEMTGEPIPGTTIQLKGTSVSVISQTDGTYSIKIPPDGTILVYSCIGYQSREVGIEGRKSIDVALTEEMRALETTITTGYSNEKVRDIVGSVAVVNTEQALNTASGNVANQLQGRVSGLNISSDGSIDEQSAVRIRGISSFGGSEPLYIIDGVPGSIDRVNPNDIQTIQILKDAAAASVYGARAASGVVVITTKQGQQGSVKFNVDYYYGINYTSERDFPDLLDANELGELIWLQMEGAGREYGDPNWSHMQYGTGPEPVIPEYILVNDNGNKIGGTALEAMKISDYERFASLVNPDNYDFRTHQIVKSGNTDWFDEVYNPAPVQNLQFSVSTGSERGAFVLGLNYYDRKSTVDKYSYNTRYMLRANTSYNILDFIKIGENLQITYTQIRNAEHPSGAWNYPAYCPIYDIAGNPTGSAIPTIEATGIGVGYNPITTPWRNRFDGSYTYGIFGNAFAEMQIFRDLVFRSSFGIDYFSTMAKDLTQITYENLEGSTPPNSLSWSSVSSNSWTFTNTLTYTKVFGHHSFKALIASEAINNFSQNLVGERADFLIDDNDDYLVIDAGTGSQTSGGSISHSGLFSVFSRLDYNYGEKYIINLTVRRDGSSRFGDNYRFGYFPALALGWRISDEKFMEGITWLSDLKLRASYGIIGNQSGLSNENPYNTYVQTLDESYDIQGVNNAIRQSYVMNRLGNKDTRWEKAISINAGLDATLFSDKVTIAFDYFIKETRDLLVMDQPPKTSPGITQPYINVGIIKNNGIEFTLTNRGTIAGAVNYEISGNFSAYRNKVLKVFEDPETTLLGGNARGMGYACLTKQGMPISYFYGYKIDGFFNTQQEVDDYVATTSNTWLNPAVGRWKILDTNGDHIVNSDDRTYLGSPHPDFQVGLNISLTYKSFDYTAFIFWNQGGDLFNLTRKNIDFNSGFYNRSRRMLEDSWTPDNTDALLPKLDINDTQSASNVTDYFVEDASYIRLRQMTLGYTLPSNLMQKLRLTKLRVYLQAQNLFTFTRFSGMDPGLVISGSNNLGLGIYSGQSPIPKQILFGINLGF